MNTVRGAFRNGPNEIRIAMLVTSELLRGSGQTVHPAVATAAGVNPGERRTFTGRHGQVTLSWKLASTRGANLSSLRAQAAAVDATAGDMLVLAVKVDDASVDVGRLGAEDVGRARLRTLLGHSVRRPVAALAAALSCQRHEVSAVLRARGDHDLATGLDSIPPIAKRHNVGAYTWGLAAGKTQTYLPCYSWEQPAAEPPKVWFHDLLKPGGRPYRDGEIRTLRQLTGRPRPA